jgi:hypothetical protein
MIAFFALKAGQSGGRTCRLAFSASCANWLDGRAKMTRPGCQEIGRKPRLRNRLGRGQVRPSRYLSPRPYSAHRTALRLRVTMEKALPRAAR